jgi:hypothetical protein
VSWRAFWALFRREVMRGRRSMSLFSFIALAAIVLAFVLTKEASIGTGAMSVMVGIIAIFAPLGDLRSDKTLGHLEFDRVLPISHRAIATARLFGAAVRTTPFLLFSLPIIITLDRDGHVFGAARLAAAIGIPLVAWLLLTGVIWAMMAVNIRWNLRHLWWLPMTIAIGPQVLISALPPAAKDAIAAEVERVGDPMLKFLSTPVGVAVLIAVMLAIPVVLFWVAISLFASGLERYTYDASAAVPMSAAPPKRELAAIGRGPTLAVARYCIRLATEQSRRRLILLAVFVAALMFGTHEMKAYAQLYVRALAAMIPGGIALQLSIARTRGHLEGIQQLPHPPITVGMGYLLGIATLATPGAAVWVLARAVTGTPATVGNTLSLWAWMVGWSWLASVSVVWLTSRRTLMIVSVPVLALVTWAMYAGLPQFIDGVKAVATAFGEFRADAGVAFPIAVAGTMMIGGLPLFARGLAEYEFAGAKSAGWWSRWQERARTRRGWGSVSS